MANLARYANVSPVDFEEMLEEDTLPLAKEVEALRRRDEELAIELAKFQAQAAMQGGGL